MIVTKGAQMKTTTNILGKKWTVYWLTQEEYTSQLDSTSVGTADTATRTIKFLCAEADIETVRHELTHAYTHEMSLTVLDLTASQVEEFYCELVGKYGKDIVTKASRIMRTQSKKK